MSDTPRTDREVYKITERDIGFEAVGATLCRTIERELAQAVNSFSETVKWVPVSEGLPRPGDPHYVLTRERDIFIAYWWRDHEHVDLGEPETGHWEDPEMGDRGGGSIVGVTHWFPYPELPSDVTPLPGASK